MENKIKNNGGIAQGNQTILKERLVNVYQRSPALPSDNLLKPINLRQNIAYFKRYPLFMGLAALLLILSPFCMNLAYSSTFDIPPELVDAIIEVESNGNPSAYNKKSGCIGLLQINPNGALKEYREFHDHIFILLDPPTPLPTKGDLYNPKTNIEIGTWYLNRLANYYLKSELQIVGNCGDLNCEICKYWNKKMEIYNIALILSAYNMGPTALKKINYDLNKAPKATQNYVRKVMRIYKQKAGGR